MKLWFSILLVVASTGAFALGQQSNPVPLVNQPLVPMTIVPGSQGFTLTVNGTGFVSGAAVKWNGAALTTTFVNSSQLTATVPASDIATPGTASVTVSNPTPGGGTSNVELFDVSSTVSKVIFTQLPPGPAIQGGGSSLLCADLNGDGKLDLAYISGVDRGTPPFYAVIQLGNGDGTFQVGVSYAVGNTPTALVVGDFNGDGKLDLAAANELDSTISVLLGNGDGTFKPEVTFPTAAAPYSLMVGDFNGDGKLDLVTGNRYQDTGDVGGVSVLLGNGDGTFQSHVDYAASLGAYWTTVGDFNRDGNLDLIFVPGGSLYGKLVLLLGNGDGTFQSPQTFPADSGIESLITADVNGDGKLDLMASDYFLNGSPGGGYVFLGNGDGTFQSPVDYGSGRTSVELEAEDFNADGKLDLVLANQDQNSFSVLLGNGDGTFQSPTDFPTSSSDLGAAAGDFNGDGKMDLAVAASSIMIFLQGQFAVASFSPLDLTFGQQAIGTTSPPQNVTLTNAGSLTLTISNISITGANFADFAQSNNCPPSLGVNANCSISVTFTPSAAGIRSGAVSITDNGVGSPQSVSLTGTTSVYLSPPSVTFPSQYVGTSGLPQTIMLNNTGSVPLAITSVTATPADFAPLSTCDNTLSPGGSCSIGVFFDPATSGTRNGTLTVTDSASDSPQTASLTGIGQDFSLAPGSQTTATVTPGQAANYTLTVAPGGGFNQTVALSCSGAPALSRCSISPTSITLDGSHPVLASVAVVTAGSSAAINPARGPQQSRVLFALAMFGGVLGFLTILGRTRGRRKPRAAFLDGIFIFWLLSVGFTVSACGGGTSRNSGTPQGSYNLMVTGTFTSGSSKLAHNINLTLVVQ